MNNIPIKELKNNIKSPHIVSKMEEIKKSINKLKDVLFSKIISAENGDIREIHVITKDCCNPKKVSRDIESLLIAQHNIAIDYRKISIAQVRDEIDYSSRIKLSDITVTSKDDRLQVIVKLENKDNLYEGKIDCTNWNENREYIVARAVLDAITAFMKGKIFFQVDEIKKIKMEDKEVLLTSVNLIDSQGKENFIGAALIREDINKTVVNAVLKAVNRRISFK